MKNKIIYIFISGILIILTFVCTYKCHETIHDIYNSIFHKMKTTKEIYINSDKIKDLPKIIDEDGAWYTKYHFISHAGGQIDGKIYTNSMEAYENSYKKGNRIIDCDMMFSVDKKLIAKHDGINLELTKNKMMDSKIFLDYHNIEHFQDYSNDKLTYDEFMNSKIYNKYTTTDSLDVLKLLKKYEDLYVSIDMKDDIYESYKYLVDQARQNKLEDVLDRIIVSIYDIKSYNESKKVYDFKNYMMRQHRVNPQNYYEIAEFMIKNDIHTLNISISYINDKEIKMLKDKGIYIYIAVIDYVSDMKYSIDKGAFGAVTNSLYEEDWNLIISK